MEGLDTDLPTALEAALLDSVAGKAFFCTFQIFFYALRPMLVYRLPVTGAHLINIPAQIAFDVLLVHLAGWKALFYLLLSSFLAGSLHPCAGHFIAEHYVFAGRGPARTANESESKSGIPVPETYSYYGPLNILAYNVGLHNEHHDFPAIPWTRLPTLHSMAKEFYADLPQHRSWVMVFWSFIFDARVGLWCRVKRSRGGRKVGMAGAKEAKSGWKEEELGANEDKQIPGVL